MNEPTTRLRLDLPLLLPDADDRCVGRLIAALSGRPGISEAHVARDADAPQLCIHYDPAQINIGRVRELVHAAGAEISERFGHLVVRADAALHARAARSVADGLRSIPGVLEADVAASGAVRIEYDRQKVSAQVLLEHAATLGLKAPDAAPADAAKADDHAGHDHAKAAGDHAGHSHAGGPFGEMTELVFSGTAGALLGVGWLLERVVAGPA